MNNHGTTLFKKMRLLSCLAALSLPCLLSGLDSKIISRAKKATAYITHRGGTASAFCIDPSGVFVTNDHVVKQSGGKVLTLYLNAGSTEESEHKARVIRSDERSDLALLQLEPVPERPLDHLQIASTEELFETQELVAFGFPFGQNLSLQEDTHPSISVNIGRITSLRQKDGVLERIQLDAQVNPGNSGGPLLNPEGDVVGIISSGVRGSGVNFAIPASMLTPLLETPDIKVTLPDIPFKERHQAVKLDAKITWFQAPPKSYEIELEVKSETESRKFKLEPASAPGKFHTEFVPIPKGNSEEKQPVQILVSFIEGEIKGTTANFPVRVGEESIPLEEISRITLGDSPRILSLNSGPIEGAVKELEQIQVRLGEQTLEVDTSKATSITIFPPKTEVPKASYTLAIHSGESKKIASVTAPIRFSARPVSMTVDTASEFNDLVDAGPANGEAETVELPGKVFDLDTGGKGRFLVLYLRDTKKLAVFDVITRKIKGYIGLAEDPVVFGASADHILISYPKSNLLVRHSLETLKKEQTITNPFGSIESIAMGFSSYQHALILAENGQGNFKDAEIKIFDFLRMTPVEAGEVEAHSFLTGKTNHLRAGADGRVFGNTKMTSSPSGVGIITFKNGKITTRYEHDSKGTVIPNPDGSLIFTSHGGAFTPEYLPVVGNKQDYRTSETYLPSYHPMYFFSVPSPSRSSRNKETPRLANLYIKGSNRPLVSMSSELEEMRDQPEESNGQVKSPFTVDKRYHFIPQANLFITFPYSNDKVVFRNFRITDLLNEKEIDYLYITSTPPPARAEQLFTYQLKAASRAGGVTFTLQSGPEGMRLSDDGLIQWNIPEKAEEESVIILVSDLKGQETYYTFQITVAD